MRKLGFDIDEHRKYAADMVKESQITLEREIDRSLKKEEISISHKAMKINFAAMIVSGLSLFIAAGALAVSIYALNVK